MQKTDVIISLVIGEIVAIFFLFMIRALGYYAIPYANLSILVFPVVFFVGLLVAEKLSYRLPIMQQFSRFVLVGLLNTVVDFGVLNLLIFITGIASGFYYSIFKTCSAILAMTNSFLWNKLWTFGKRDATYSKEELPRFLIVTISGAAINIGIASLVVNIVGAPAGFDPKLWANIGAGIATVVGFLWNFLGYKFFAFRA